MSSVKTVEALRLIFFLKAVLVFPFRRSGYKERFLGAGNGLNRCSSCYPCAAPEGRHQLTRAVTAKKRARPISKSGRRQPQCASGRAPFQIVSVRLHSRFQSRCLAKVKRPRPSSSRRLPPTRGRCARATDPPPSAAPSPRWLSSSRPSLPSGCRTRVPIS
jgi:hypothetical protein